MSRHPRRAAVTVLLILVVYGAMALSLVPSMGEAYAGHRGMVVETIPYVVRIRATTDEARRVLAGRGIDLLEQRTEDALFALVSEGERKALTAEGWQVKIEVEQSALVKGALLLQTRFRDGYRTVEETEALLRSVAERYPDIAELVDYGDSWEKTSVGSTGGHDLWAIRLTNKAISGPKPVFLLLAAVHPREIVTSELATRYISYLLDRYGHDADVTWMLDEHEVVVIPMANPDGRKLVEQGYLQRKNTNGSEGRCVTPPSINNQPGIDLNRNFSFAWGTVNAPVTPPCSETFPGPSAASEPETVALQTFIRGLFPDQRGSSQSDAAPPTATGIMISLHAYSNLVLWPWGYSDSATPNGVALARLGARFSTFNGYKPQQSFDLYATSGTTEDWIYGELGVASFTFEVGPAGSAECANFLPPITCLDGGQGGRFWPLNQPAFLYATRVARAPYTQPSGPDVSAIKVISDTERITVTATLDSRTTSRPIRGAALYIQHTPWRGGTPVSLLPQDGSFDATHEQVYVVVPKERIDKATMLLLQGQSEEWGPISTTWVAAPEPRPQPPFAAFLPAVRARGR